MKGRTILITGGTGKIGHTLIDHFLSIGDSIVTTFRTDESMARLRARYSYADKRLIGIKADLTSRNAIKMVLTKLESQNIFCDCLINNARNLSYLNLEEGGLVSRENFANEYLLDVIVPYELTMALASQKNSQMRRIINIGSMYGAVAANPNLYVDSNMYSPLHYGVAKAALVHLTKELAVRLANKDIQVNCIAFGGLEGRVNEAFKRRYAQLCPMGRMLRDDEVVGPVDMLLSDKCSGMTGHTLVVDGGWSIW